MRDGGWGGHVAAVLVPRRGGGGRHRLQRPSGLPQASLASASSYPAWTQLNIKMQELQRVRCLPTRFCLNRPDRVSQENEELKAQVASAASAADAHTSSGLKATGNSYPVRVVFDMACSAFPWLKTCMITAVKRGPRSVQGQYLALSLLIKS